MHNPKTQWLPSQVDEWSDEDDEDFMEEYTIQNR